MDGLTSGGANREWDDVLTALEDDIRRTERAMREPVRISEDLLGQVAPSQSRLPAPTLAPDILPSMPPVETMPPLSPQVESRIRDLSVRIVALQLQLRDELAALRLSHASPSRPVSASLTAAVGPHFFDSRV